MENIHELFQILTRRFGLMNKSCCCNCGCGEVSQIQSQILFEIGRSPDSPMQQIAEAVGADITTFSRQIQTLAASGFVEKTNNADDKRVYTLRLAPKGKETVDSIGAQMNDYLRGVFSYMNDFEKETVLRSVVLLNSAMAKSKDCCRPLK